MDSPLIAWGLTQQQEPNLRWQEKENSWWLHVQEGASQEATCWFQSLSLQRVDRLFILGVGLGYGYQAAEKWLHASVDRTLIFIEDQPAIFSHFLASPLGLAASQDSQVELYLFPDLLERSETLRILARECALKSYALTSLPSYAKYRAQWVASWEALFVSEIQAASVPALELQYWGLPFFENFYRNFSRLDEAYQGASLFGKFSGIPAIITGAGPSLEEALPLLEQAKESALLIAAGSSLNLLDRERVFPHFGVAIDPTAQMYHRLVMSRSFEVPIFYQQRIHAEALAAIHGPKLALSSLSLYPITTQLEAAAGLFQPPIQGGISVLLTAIEIAYRLGCTPIFLVGCDFCRSFHQQKRYATGLEQHPLFSGKMEMTQHLKEPISVRNRQQESVLSYWSWMLEAEQVAWFAKIHPEVSFFHTSFTSLSIPEVPYQPLFPLLGSFPKIDNLNHKIRSILATSTPICASKAHLQSLLLDWEKRLEINRSGAKELFSPFETFFEDTYPLRCHRKDPASRALKKSAFFREIVLIQRKILHSLHWHAASSGREREEIEHIPPQIERYFYVDGRLKSEIPWERGALHGAVRLFYPNGQLKRVLHFADHEREGIDQTFEEDGQLSVEVLYQANQPQSAQAVWGKLRKSWTSSA